MKSIACTISVLALALLAGCQCQPTHNAYGFDLRPRYEREVKFVAHRGESTVAPENTVPAYELAWRNNAAWGVETDVYLTKDVDYTIDLGGLDFTKTGTYTITYTYIKDTTIKTTLTINVVEG